jgi:hypothetical protein
MERLSNRNEFDYIIKYIKLVPQNPSKTPNSQGWLDFSENYVEFSYEESIFEIGISGSMFVVDAVDYPTLLPIIGEERMQISFTRSNNIGDGEFDPITFDLPIYEVGGRTQDGKSRKRQTYTLYYGSESIFKNLDSKLFRKYKDMPYSDMVKKIYDEYLKVGDKEIFVEPTKHSMDFFAQNMSPIKAIRQICKRSVSAEGNGSYYVFYEDRDRFNFVTLSYLAKQEPIITLLYQPKNTIDDKTLKKNTEKDMYNVNTIKNYSNINPVASAISGEATASILTIDPLRRKKSLKALDLRGSDESVKKHGIELLQNVERGWDSFNHVQSAKPWTNNNKMFTNPLSNLNVAISDMGHEFNEYITERDSSAKSNNIEDYVLQRNSSKLQFMKNVITTTVSGDPRIKAGNVVHFKIPEFMGKVNTESKEELDKYLQGNYLVVSIAHIINSNSYKMNLELIKDSYFSDIEARDPVEEYKNIL